MAKVALECKKSMVKEISSQLNDVQVLIVTSYKGLGAQDINELRKELHRISADYLVVKDSMAKIALKESVSNRLTEFVKGEIGIAIHKDDPIHLSKVLVKFSKDHEVLKISGGITKGEILTKQDILNIASLPSREVLLTKLVIILNSPMQGMASTLLGIIRKLLYALEAVRKKKENTQGVT